MYQVLLTYEISEPAAAPAADSYARLRAGLMHQHSFCDRWVTVSSDTQETITYSLPTSSMWHKSTTVASAKQSLLDVAGQLGLTVERVVAVELSKWSGIPGTPYQDNE